MRVLWRGLPAVVVLASAVLVAAPAGAQTPETGYADVPEGAYYREPVAVLEDMGIFEGTDCAEGFCPGDHLKRWQMAVWLVRVLDGKDPVAIEESRFIDLGGYERWQHSTSVAGLCGGDGVEVAAAFR